MKNISKSLSYWLRHRPDAIGIELDGEGWTDLVTLSEKSGFGIRQIGEVVRTCEKQRFSVKDGKIRANQGHSVRLEIKFSEITPPEFLYHGTADRFVDSIKKEGLKPMNRHHVHLSKDVATAIQVGSRRGKAALLQIDAQRMHADGIKFYISENGVYLVDAVDPKYIVGYKTA